MSWQKYFLKAILGTLPTLIGASLISFALIRLAPGDPVTLLLGERGGSPELVHEITTKLGLDRPLWQQYIFFVGGFINGDLGTSIVTRVSVWSEFRERLPATVELSAVAMIWATFLGMLWGGISALNRNRWVDRLLMSVSLVGYSFPIFWLGLLLISLFSIKLGWTPVSGRMGVIFEIPSHTGFLLMDCWFTSEGWPAFVEALRHLALPSLTLGTIPMAAIARMTRASLLEIMHEDYVRTAHAKGLPLRQVFMKHILTNAMGPILTVIGLMLGTLLTGAILTETVFAWPGLGRWLVQGVLARDYPVIQSAILLFAMMMVLLNLAIELLYFWLDPRLRGRDIA